MSQKIASILAMVSTLLLSAQAPAQAQQAGAAACPAILKQTFNRLQDDAPQNLCQYAGKVILVVNTASYCGYTKQYEGLEALYAKYGAKGLVVASRNRVHRRKSRTFATTRMA
jgi:glutathione peroxidase